LNICVLSVLILPSLLLAPLSESDRIDEFELLWEEDERDDRDRE